jgi:adenylate kinase
VESVIASGQLVSDDLINRVVAERLRHTDCRSGCILDGYPRTASQACFLEALLQRLNLSQPVVFNFDLAVENVVDRLGSRRQCPVCGSIFNVKQDAKQVRCERDGSPLIQRADDNPSAIRQRLELYRKTSADLIDFYRSQNYHEISASRTPDEVFDELTGRLGMRVPAAAIPPMRRSVPLSATA